MKQPVNLLIQPYHCTGIQVSNVCVVSQRKRWIGTCICHFPPGFFSSRWKCVGKQSVKSRLWWTWSGGLMIIAQRWRGGAPLHHKSKSFWMRSQSPPTASQLASLFHAHIRHIIHSGFFPSILLWCPHIQPHVQLTARHCGTHKLFARRTSAGLFLSQRLLRCWEIKLGHCSRMRPNHCPAGKTPRQWQCRKELMSPTRYRWMMWTWGKKFTKRRHAWTGAGSGAQLESRCCKAKFSAHLAPALQTDSSSSSSSDSAPSSDWLPLICFPAWTCAQRWTELKIFKK